VKTKSSFTEKKEKQPSGEDKTKPNHNLRQYLEQQRCGEGGIVPPHSIFILLATFQGAQKPFGFQPLSIRPLAPRPM
jgi:hypothetical protein